MRGGKGYVQMYRFNYTIPVYKNLYCVVYIKSKTFKYE